MGLKIVLALILVFIGLGVLIFTAYLAYNSFVNYTPIEPRGESLEEAVSTGVFELINLAARIAFLGIMGWVGSVILGKGMNMYIEASKESF